MDPRNWWDGIAAKGRLVLDAVPAWAWVLSLAGIVGAVSAVLAVVAIGRTRAAATPLSVEFDVTDGPGGGS